MMEQHFRAPVPALSTRGGASSRLRRRARNARSRRIPTRGSRPARAMVEALRAAAGRPAAPRRAGAAASMPGAIARRRRARRRRRRRRDRGAAARPTIAASRRAHRRRAARRRDRRASTPPAPSRRRRQASLGATPRTIERAPHGRRTSTSTLAQARLPVAHRTIAAAGDAGVAITLACGVAASRACGSCRPASCARSSAPATRRRLEARRGRRAARALPHATRSSPRTAGDRVRGRRGGRRSARARRSELPRPGARRVSLRRRRRRARAAPPSGSRSTSRTATASCARVAAGRRRLALVARRSRPRRSRPRRGRRHGEPASTGTGPPPPSQGARTSAAAAIAKRERRRRRSSSSPRTTRQSRSTSTHARRRTNAGRRQQAPSSRAPNETRLSQQSSDRSNVTARRSSLQSQQLAKWLLATMRRRGWIDEAQRTRDTRRRCRRRSPAVPTSRSASTQVAPPDDVRSAFLALTKQLPPGALRPDVDRAAAALERGLPRDQVGARPARRRPRAVAARESLVADATVPRDRRAARTRSRRRADPTTARQREVTQVAPVAPPPRPTPAPANVQRAGSPTTGCAHARARPATAPDAERELARADPAVGPRPSPSRPSRCRSRRDDDRPDSGAADAGQRAAKRAPDDAATAPDHADEHVASAQPTRAGTDAAFDERAELHRGAGSRSARRSGATRAARCTALAARVPDVEAAIARCSSYARGARGTDRRVGSTTRRIELQRALQLDPDLAAGEDGARRAARRRRK